MIQNEKSGIFSDNHRLRKSVIGIVPDSTHFRFQSKNIEKVLKQNSHFTLLKYEGHSNLDNMLEKTYTIQVAYLGEIYNISLSILSVVDLDLQDFGLTDMISDIDEYNVALQQEYYLETSLLFGSKPLEAFHLQLKILDAVVSQASLVIDFMSLRLYSGKAIRLTAKSAIAPSPDYLYALHALYQDNGNEIEYWLHTHGLLRCGIVELEIIGIKSGPQQMANLINSVVKKLLHYDIEENTPFNIGYDGMNIRLIWVNRDDALHLFPDSILGGRLDRIPGKSSHLFPSGILFALEDKTLISPEIYTSTLTHNPIWYISDEETQRMSELARERYMHFLLLFKKHNHLTEDSFLNNFFQKKKADNNDKWNFCVKIGLPIDNPQRKNQKEHLWYKVVAADNNVITGKLLNQPYWVSSLTEGNIGTYPIELLTDWNIVNPDNKLYTPDSIYELVDV